jgi:hypothetical protein
MLGGCRKVAEKVVEFTKSGGNAIFSAKTHIPSGGSHISTTGNAKMTV